MSGGARKIVGEQIEAKKVVFATKSLAFAPRARIITKGFLNVIKEYIRMCQKTCVAL